MKLLDWVPLEKLDWDGLSSNPDAIHLLDKNPDKIDWYWLSMNPGIFEEDYQTLSTKG
jgi:hypothetical protein